MKGKSITVTVTDENGKTFTSPATSTVTEEASIDEIKIDNITPKVGETVTATAYDGDGKDITNECSWSWYRVNKATGTLTKIANQKKNSYTLTTMDSGNTVYAEAADNDGHILQSEEAHVVKVTDVVDVQLETPSGKQSYSRINDVPLVGDELIVDMHNSQAQLDAQYQWMRDTSPIVGATSSAYTLTNDDEGTNISVKVKIPATEAYGFDAGVIESNATFAPTAAGLAAFADTGVLQEATFEFDNAVASDISNAEIKLDRTSPSVGQTITVTKVVYDTNHDGDTTDSTDKLAISTALNVKDVYISWFRDDVYVGSGSSYKVTYADLGKPITVKATGTAINDPTSKYYGDAETATDDVVCEIKNVTINVDEITGATKRGDAAADKDNTIGLLGTSFSVSATDTQGGSIDSKNLDITWTLGKDGASSIVTGVDSITIDKDTFDKIFKDQNTKKNGTDALDGATGADAYTYLDAAVDLADVINVSVSGKGDYTGTETQSAAGEAARYASNAPAVLRSAKVKDKVGAATFADAGAANTKVATGKSLEVVTVPSAAAKDIKWTWVDSNASDTVFTDIGTKYTVPTGDGTGHVIGVFGVFKDEPAFDWALNTDTTAGADRTVAHNTPTGNTAFTDEIGDLYDDTAGTSVVIGGALDEANPMKSVATTNDPDMGGVWTFTGLDSVTVAYSNNAGKATEKPEVGGFITVTTNVQATLNAYWKDEKDHGYTGTDLVADDTVIVKDVNNSTEKVQIFKITSDCIGRAIQFKATASGTGYAGDKTVNTDVIVPSTRTIAGFKVLNKLLGAERDSTNDDVQTWYKKDDKADYDDVKNVQSLDANKNYVVVAIDSNGELVNEAVSVVTLRSQNKKDIDTISWNGDAKTSFADISNAVDTTTGYTATFIVVPDGAYYVGDSVEFTFTSKTIDSTP